MQTDQELREATESVCRRLASMNVAYAELRLCPELHTRCAWRAPAQLENCARKPTSRGRAAAKG